jgi:heme/copper-type cytochrome/quinol oxidase subunit 2
MLLLGILGNMGIYTGAVEMLQQWHIFFSLSIGGIIAGIVEAAIIGFIFGYAFGWLYNKFA